MEITRGIQVHFEHAKSGRKQIKSGPEPVKDMPQGRVPRLSRLMALAIHFDSLIRQGGIYNQADLAQLGHVSRARVTQIMNMLHLAPDIQEQILYLPRVMSGDDPYPERKIRRVIRQWDWKKQRQIWSQSFIKNSASDK